MLHAQLGAGLKLRYYDLPVVIGAHGIGACPDNYYTFEVLRQVLRTGRAPLPPQELLHQHPLPPAFVTVDVVAAAMATNCMRGDGGDPIVRVQQCVEGAAGIARVMRWFGDQTHNVFYSDGTAWDPAVIPDDFVDLLSRLPCDCVGEMPRCMSTINMESEVDLHYQQFLTRFSDVTVQHDEHHTMQCFSF
eukprot:TRINITY_DN5149_c0_g1_i5.p1 TRINITY_DN5149_c0_g1~~TRINITY_DN5149_c0_g1_i5.p1  ORF type:complete len:190 (+),score=41.27 TRINITY_DN5149_c0_g1_i5:67-636(+)